MLQKPDRSASQNILPFAASVYENRLALIQEKLAERRLAGVLLFDPENTFWLTGYQTIGYFTFQTIFVPLKGRPVVISRTVNRTLALAHGVFEEFVAISDTEDPVVTWRVPSLSSRHVVLLGFHIGLDEFWRDETHLVAQARQGARPEMSGGAGFHRYAAFGCDCMNARNCLRDSFLRNTTSPSAVAPCS